MLGLERLPLLRQHVGEYLGKPINGGRVEGQGGSAQPKSTSRLLGVL